MRRLPSKNRLHVFIAFFSNMSRILDSAGELSDGSRPKQASACWPYILALLRQDASRHLEWQGPPEQSQVDLVSHFCVLYDKLFRVNQVNQSEIQV